MPSRVTAVGMFWWGVGLMVVGVVAAVLPFALLDSGSQLGIVFFQWVWHVLSMLQYVGAGMVAVALGVRAIEGRFAPQGTQPDQVLAEPGPYGPGGGHPNPQP